MKRAAMIIAASLMVGATAHAADNQHPLDGLSAEEFDRTVEILRGNELANEQTLYPLIELVEPAKAEVLAWDGQTPLDRRVEVQFGDESGFKLAVVNLTEGAVEEIGPAAGEPMVLLAEFLDAVSLAPQHEEMAAGLEKRGLGPDDVFCLPATAGNFKTGEEDGRRLMKVPCYKLPDGSNFYAKPIEGLFAVVDIGKREVLRVVDEDVVPIAEDEWGYSEDEVAARMPLRPASNAAKLLQDGRPNYTLDGHALTWDIWRMRLRTDKRPGLVLSNIDVKDGEAWRSVLYQAHLSEVFVPYMDPSEGWYWRTYMDSGEYGFGLFLTPLTPRVDCPAYATYLPALVNADNGSALEIPNAICIFERNIGDPAWRHFEVFAQGEGEEGFVPADGRPETELVVRTASAVGNYDYLIDYRFKQNGEIWVKIGATGIDVVKGVKSTSMDDETAAEDTAYGTLIAPNLVAPNHDHYFNFRFDFDIDQPKNRFGLMEIVAADRAEGAPRSMWSVKKTMPESELDARYTISAAKRQFYHVMNMENKGVLGHHPGYMIHHGSVAYGPFDYAGDLAMKRNAYIEYSVWNTPYDPAQRYAGGKFAFQSDGSDSLPEWVKANRSLTDADVVTWFTAGFHHVPRVEDWPVMSTDWKSIHIMPHNFFGHNPALTIRKD
ncbi:MAG: tyramine oxidase [Pseudomonadota bacterium]